MHFTARVALEKADSSSMLTITYQVQGFVN